MYEPSYSSTVEAVLCQRLAGQTILNVIHLRPDEVIPGNWPEGDTVLDGLAEILTHADTGWAARHAVVASDELEYVYLQLQFINPTRYAYKRYAPGVDVGTQAGVPLPPNMACSVTIQSDATGPHSRGRIQFAGLMADNVTDGFVDGVVRGHLEGVAQFLMGPFSVELEAPNLAQVIYNRALPSTSQFVTHCISQETVRTMRRRTVGLGS